MKDLKIANTAETDMEDRGSLSETINEDDGFVRYESSFDIQDYIPYNLVRTQLWMHKVVSYEDAPAVKAIADISKTETRIMTLVARQQSITPSQLADTMGYDRAIVTRVIASLLKKDLIYTKPSPEDQRSKAVYLTKRGAALCDALVPVFEKFTDHLESVLEPDEKKTLLATLEKLLNVSKTYKP